LASDIDVRIQSIIDALPALPENPSGQKGVSTAMGAIRDGTIERVAALAESIELTIRECRELDEIVSTLATWMHDHTIVRVLGAGRARLAASLAANRLAHGGAQVSIEGDLVPLPHLVKGGAILAASASGENKTLLAALEGLKRSEPHITILGIASAKAAQFQSLCHHFIGIRLSPRTSTAPHALADFGELVITEVLDALTVAAGQLRNYDERMWKLGHENVGPTGPYDTKLAINLMFYES
jgi:D-arabinose 5-phosphate isomerase GutQ